MASSSYAKAHDRYREFAKDPAKRGDKIKAHQEVMAMEREAAAAGVVLCDGKKVSEGHPTKRSLQEEYVRKFATAQDGQSERTVRIGEGETTLSDFHRKRLLGK